MSINAQNGLLPILVCKPELMQMDPCHSCDLPELCIVECGIKGVDLASSPLQEAFLKRCLTLQGPHFLGWQT